MIRHSVILAILTLAAALAGCAGSGSGPVVAGAEQPMSQQPATSDIRQRAKVHTELGSLYLQDGRYAVALEEARIALSIDSGYAPAYSLLGLTHMFLNENPLAEENFEKALRIVPGDPEINNNFGWFLCQSGREKRSLDYFMKAARNPLYATPTKPWTNAGICSIRLKDDKAAEDHLVRARRLDPGNTQALYWLADIAYRQARLLEARQLIADLDRMNEPTPESTWLALRVERKLGNREAEARHAAQIRRRFQGSAEFRKLTQGHYD